MKDVLYTTSTPSPGFWGQILRLEKAGRLGDPASVKKEISGEDFLRFALETKLNWPGRPMNFTLASMDVYNKFLTAPGLPFILNFVEDAQVVKEETPEEPEWVAVAEVHRPPLTGCEAWLEHQVTTGKKLSASVKISGCGGGVGTETDVVIKDKIPAKTGCVTVVEPFRVHKKWMMSQGISWLWVDVEPVEGGGTEPIAKDSCGQSVTGIPLGERIYDKPTAGGANKEISETIGKKRNYKGSVGLKLGPVDATVEGSSEWSRDVTYGYSLVQGYQYVSYRPNDAVGRLWCSPSKIVIPGGSPSPP